MYELAFENGEVVALSESLEDMLIAEQEADETDEFWDEVYQGLRERYKVLEEPESEDPELEELEAELEGLEAEDIAHINGLFRQ